MAWSGLVEQNTYLLFLDDEEGWSPLPPGRMVGLGSPWNREDSVAPKIGNA
jgi:hypothetical protein